MWTCQKSLWTVVLTIGIMGLETGVVLAADVVTVNANYVPANNPFPAVTRPSGTVSVAAGAQPEWRVQLDYGTLPGGVWTPWAQGPATVNVTIAVPQNGGPVNWQQAGSVPMTGKPDNLYVRAVLQKKPMGGNWADVHTAYNTVP